MCWRNRRETLARLGFFQSIVAWSLQSSCLIKRNTIFNTTIQNKPFSSTLLKKKPGKLKREKEKAHHLAKGREERQEGTQSGVTNGQTSIHQEAIKTTLEKEGVRYVQFVRRLGTGWERKRAWGGWLKDGGLVQYFYGVFLFLKFFYFLFYVFSFWDSGRDIFAFHA